MEESASVSVERDGPNVRARAQIVGTSSYTLLFSHPAVVAAFRDAAGRMRIDVENEYEIIAREYSKLPLIDAP